MVSLYIGFFLVVSILAGALTYSKSDMSIFMNTEGLLIVIGGTLAVLLIGSRFNGLILLAKHFFQYVVRRNNKEKLQELLMKYSKSIEQDKIPQYTEHKFLNKCFVWLSAGLKGKALENLLIEGAQRDIERVSRSAQILSNLAKYPPALGMIGTVFGIIGIFNNLGNNGAKDSLGMGLAMAMTATLYGLVLSNFVLLPLSELISQAVEEEEENYEMIVQTVKYWSEKESTLYIKEHIGLFNDAA